MPRSPKSVSRPHPTNQHQQEAAGRPKCCKHSGPTKALPLPSTTRPIAVSGDDLSNYLNELSIDFSRAFSPSKPHRGHDNVCGEGGRRKSSLVRNHNKKNSTTMTTCLFRGLEGGWKSSRKGKFQREKQSTYSIYIL